MTKAKHFILYLMALMLAVGIGGCNKKESEELKEPTPQEKPTPGPDKPDPGKPDLYQEAFESMRQTHDYNKLVEDLVEAANANVDSANLSLAYMYEYGVGVEQDIAKAKSYYAKEAALNSNEFALEKIGSLDSGNDNYKITLPKECSLKMNDVMVLYGDSLTFANGDGTFYASSDMVVVRNLDNELVEMCYRHPSQTGKIEINSKETALSLLLGFIPNGFHYSKDAYAQARKMILDMEETDLIAKNIDSQLKEKGFFDLDPIVPYLSDAYTRLYTTLGPQNNSLSKSTIAKKESDDTFCYTLDDGKGHRVFVGEGSVKNNITTTIKSGNYNTNTNSWDLTLAVENLSQSSFMAVEGRIDYGTGKFIPKYSGMDYYLNANYVCASDFFDLGGGSIAGMAEVLWNYVDLTADNILKDRSSDYKIPVIDDYKEGFAIIADTQHDYQKKYLAVKADIDVEVSTPLDALEYVYPYNDVLEAAYFIIYYLAMPMWDFYSAQQGISSDETSRNVFAVVFTNIIKEFLGDKEWVDEFVQFCTILKEKDWRNWMDKDVSDFWYKTYCKIYDVIEDSYKEINGNSISPVAKYSVKSTKTVVKLYDKYSSGDVKKSVFTTLKEGEKWIFELPALKEVKKTVIKPVMAVFTSAQSLITFFDCIFNVVMGDYRTFDVRLSAISEEMELSYHPIENVTNGTPAELNVSTTRKGTISIYADDKLLASEDDVLQLKYDLSVLDPGIYKIYVQCVSFDKVNTNASTFMCTVHPEESLLYFELDNSVVMQGEALDMSVNTNRNSVVDIYVDDKIIKHIENMKDFSVALPTSVVGLHNGKVVVNRNGVEEEQPFVYTVERKPIAISDVILSASIVGLNSTIRGFVSTDVECDFTVSVVIDGVIYELDSNKGDKYFSWDLPTNSPGEIKGWVTVFKDGDVIEGRSFSYTVVSLKITDLTLTGNSIEQDDYFILSGKVTETCDIAVYVENVLVSTIKNNNEFYVTMPTDKVGKVSGMIKTKLFDIENEQSFTYTVLPKPTETDASVTPSLPNVSGSKLENDGQASGTAPGVKGQDVNQTYNGSGSAPDVKGENLDQIYNGSGSAPDVKGTNL